MLVHFKGEGITNYVLIESLMSTAVFKGSFRLHLFLVLFKIVFLCMHLLSCIIAL